MPHYTNRARKDLEALPISMQSKARALVKQLDRDPTLGTKLKGKLVGNRSIGLGRSHRIIYSVENFGILVKVIHGRKDLYR